MIGPAVAIRRANAEMAYIPRTQKEWRMSDGGCRLELMHWLGGSVVYARGSVMGANGEAVTRSGIHYKSGKLYRFIASQKSRSGDNASGGWTEVLRIDPVNPACSRMATGGGSALFPDGQQIEEVSKDGD